MNIFTATADMPQGNLDRHVQSALKHGGALSYIARWESWYAAGNFGQERL